MPHIAEARPALECHRAILFVKPDDAVAVRSFSFIVTILGVCVGDHRYFVAEAILEIASPRQRTVRNGVRFGVLVERMPPATVDGVDQCRAREAVRAVAVVIDPVLYNHREMLVATEMHRPSAANECHRLVARRLRPAVAVEICQQTALRPTMHMHCAAKRCLREDTLHLGIRPVFRPVFEEIFLTRSKQLQSGKIDCFRVILWIVDVVGAWPHLRNLARWAALELAILQYREIHTADGDSREINADTTIHRLGIRTVRQVP